MIEAFSSRDEILHLGRIDVGQKTIPWQLAAWFLSCRSPFLVSVRVLAFPILAGLLRGLGCLVCGYGVPFLFGFSSVLVTVLLKECQDIQLRCGGNPPIPMEDALTTISAVTGDLISVDTVISEHIVSYASFQLTFKDINELVEQNVKLRSLVHRLSTDEEKKEAELRYNFQVELQRVADDASTKVEVVLKRSEEQASMIESLHSSVAMYKRLYEEEHKFRTSSYASTTAVSDEGKKELMLLFEGSQTWTAVRALENSGQPSLWLGLAVGGKGKGGPY
ncbi:Nuclear-pore anchor [Dendrobium catenatum]|uniref:Nuclear-pore anchor n=1 Tax=Dendrobium catenatum TaxID=906689 RepID=A0A2I0WHH3_9ASPA|nr:Nuclear-pore anchor [Dendrobium catenatum]